MGETPTSIDIYRTVILEHSRVKGFSFNENTIIKLSEQAVTLIEGVKFPDGKELPSLMALLPIYDLAILIDDSGSMRFDEAGTRKQILEQVLKIIAHVYQFATDSGEIRAIRFLNSRKSPDNVKNSDIDGILKDHGYIGLTKIGTELENKILKPLVNVNMTRPLLVMVITDGDVEGESKGHLQAVIKEYVNMLKPTKDNFVVFQFSRVGNDEGAKTLLEGLDNLPELNQYIDCQPAKINFKLVDDAILSDQFGLVVELMIGAISEAVDQ